MVESEKFLGDRLMCEWAYFIDFENKTLETWASGKKLDVIGFEKLAKEGAKYMETLAEKENESEEDEPEDQIEK